MDNLPKQPGFPVQSTPPPPVPEVVAQPQQPKKKSIIKIFAILAVFLFLVLASELAYYFFTVKRREAGQEPLTAQIPEQLQPGKPTPTPTPTPTEEDILGGSIDQEKALEVIPFDFSKSVYLKGEVKLIHGGKITEITTNEGESTTIRIQTTTAPTEEYGIRFSKYEVDNMSILARKEGQQAEPIAFENISVGDIIKIIQTFNILDKPGNDTIMVEVERGDEE